VLSFVSLFYVVLVAVSFLVSIFYFLYNYFNYL